MPFRDVIGHERPKAILTTALRHDRLAHAYLFCGEDSIGKKLTAQRFAQAINCDTEPGPEGPDACGACKSCVQMEGRTHPDLLVIEPDPEQANPQIKIEQIREVEQWIIYQPLVGRTKICLIDEADRMTLGAANALLKTLEEPPAHSLLLLITSRPSALPATVRSRCHAVHFTPPARTQVEAALIVKREIPPADARLLAVVSQARIGQALTMDLAETRTKQEELATLASPTSLQSVTAILTAAEALHKSGRGPEALEWLAGWVRDLILVRIGADPDHLLHPEHVPLLQAAAREARVDQLLDLLDDIDALQRAASRNLNLQLALENSLLRMREAVLGTGERFEVQGSR
jgi:DNA polymerase-3 subunit delta'